MLKDLIPWRQSQKELPERQMRPRGIETGLTSLRHEMDRLFEEFARDFWPESGLGWSEEMSSFMPSIDVKETDDELMISAELPGLKEEDIDVELTGEALILKGEKRQEQEEKSGEFQRLERRYGSFVRTVPLSAGVDREKVEAEFKDGVLKVRLPKTEEGRTQHRKIPVKGS